MCSHDLRRLLESRSSDGFEPVREVAERLLQELIEAEVASAIAAEWSEHTDTRTTWRNGHRDKTVVGVHKQVLRRVPVNVPADGR
ncbi:transposase [Streptomyces turgidiscabies]|uniref:transposase n=1 Tax=Streptomyces turgidiscabies TaxID=85558 RepID=UPI000694D65A|nr:MULTISPECIES: transposase [Streptomyces]MDX3496666.1 transposase [Streptomyces turgidiscabies]